jgi:SepF-like predicted cell division protein (DUF552 family)
MVKCSSCGFDNREAKVCGKCGRSIQRYVKALPFREFDEVAKIEKELSLGNVLIVNLMPFFEGREKIARLDKLQRAIVRLRKCAESIGGGISRLGDERLILVPPPFKIWASKAETKQAKEKPFIESPFLSEEKVPSAGTLARFFAANFSQLTSLLEEAKKNGKLDELKEDFSAFSQHDVFAEMAMETGKFRETILALERLKDEVGGAEIGFWTLETQLSILCSFKPGFEEYLAELFFTKERCKNCKREGKAETRCREGLSDYIFDKEFEQFEDESVQKIVEQLKNGVEPKLLEVPKHLQEQWIKFRKLCEAGAQKSD